MPAMPDFRELITREAKILDSLPLREMSAHRPFWQDHVDQIRKKTVVRSPQTVEFMISFLEVDPWFWGSGYMKEKLIRRLKQAPLNEPCRRRACAPSRSTRCCAVRTASSSTTAELARALQTPDFVGNIERLATESNTGSDDGAVRARARRMLRVMASLRSGSP